MDDLEIADVEKILDPNQSGEFEIMLTEFKISINDYLKDLTNSPVKSLADVIAFNCNNSELVSKRHLMTSLNLPNLL